MAIQASLTGRKIVIWYLEAWAGMAAAQAKIRRRWDGGRLACYMAPTLRREEESGCGPGLAERCEVQLAYAIRLPGPYPVNVQHVRNGTVEEEQLVELVRELFPLSTPKGMISHLKLRRHFTRKTILSGHFGQRRFVHLGKPRTKPGAQRRAGCSRRSGLGGYKIGLQLQGPAEHVPTPFNAQLKVTESTVGSSRSGRGRSTAKNRRASYPILSQKRRGCLVPSRLKAPASLIRTRFAGEVLRQDFSEA